MRSTHKGRLMMQDRRSFYRHPFHYPVRVVEEDGSNALRSVNISLGGICVPETKSFTRGQSVRVEIPLKDRTFKMKGQVSYCVRNKSTSSYLVGIAFQDKSSVFMAKMAEEILCIEKFRDRMSRRLDHSVGESEAADEWIRKHASRFADYFRC